MDKDFSRLLYDKYFGLTNRDIEVKLKDGTVSRCVIIGFYKKGEEDTSYITKWHIVGATDKNRLGINPLDILNGVIIDNSHIAEIKFLQDGTELKFD